MIAWVKRLATAPGEVDRLRQQLEELRAEEKRLRTDIDNLNSALMHWRRLAGALRDCNADLDRRLTESEEVTR
jgi:cell division protein FtsB